MTEPTAPTPPTWSDLVAYVGGNATRDQGYAERKLAQAQRLVTRYVLDNAPADTLDVTDVVPADVLYEAFLEVGKALWARRATTGGTGQYETIDAPATSVLGDPLTEVYPDLDRFLPLGGFA